MRVCEAGRPCEFRPTESATFRPEDANRQGERQQDPDAYRGENLAELRAAAQAGDPGAAYRLGLVHQQGLAGAPRDPRLATRYFESAADGRASLGAIPAGPDARPSRAPTGRGAWN